MQIELKCRYYGVEITAISTDLDRSNNNLSKLIQGVNISLTI